VGSILASFFFRYDGEIRVYANEETRTIGKNVQEKLKSILELVTPSSSSKFSADSSANHHHLTSPSSSATNKNHGTATTTRILDLYSQLDFGTIIGKSGVS
jgi:hypothetical protein